MGRLVTASIPVEVCVTISKHGFEDRDRANAPKRVDPISNQVYRHPPLLLVVSRRIFARGFGRIVAFDS